MMTSNHVIDVSEADFEYEVLAYSQHTPVVVDFWAEWCTPCKALGPVLERLAQESQGEFRLAKVNVDQNSSLALRYRVSSIPAVKAFRDGAVVAEFVGVQPEPRLREFIRGLAPTLSDLALEKGNSLLNLRKAAEAEAAFQQVLQAQPARTEALLGVAKANLLQGRAQEARSLLERLPASREYASAQLLLPLARSLEHMNADPIFQTEDAHDPGYFNALRLVRRGNLEAAMDGLLDILREDKRYRGGLAREAMLALLELTGASNPITRQYRNELALVLF